MTTSSLIFVFVDGLGLGLDDPTVNPLANADCPALTTLAGGELTSGGVKRVEAEGWLVKPIDANLGMEGLPQSGTGQATMLTGLNCAALAGRHYGPFPHSTSKTVIAEQNIFKQLVDAGLDAAFANAYPDRFFTYVEKTNRWTVTTLCCLEAGISLKRGDDLEKGNAIAADITNANWPEVSRAITAIDPAAAGGRLAAIAHQNHFTLFEYFATDKAGHSRDHARALLVLKTLDAFIGGIVAAMDFSTQSLLITSDHGNIEDLSTKTHTRNAVPLIVKGPAAKAFAGLEDLTGISPAILAALRHPAPRT